MDTIAAIATPPGEGGVAIIRISGPRALALTARFFSGPVQSYASHTAHTGKVLSETGEKIDDVLLLVMRTPRSYTGEDTVEIHCHGGSLITKRVLERVLRAGARAAQPGEFTYRAFLNGKIDLAQAEAVQQLIGAKNDLAIQAASEQLSGALSSKVSALQHELIDHAAILEAWVDFPEEDLEFASFEELISSIENTRAKLHSLIATFEEGKMLHEGLSLCLIGPPNAGKSSLLNALLGSERAIVSPIPGTTRDLLEETMRLGGLHVRLTDTAGIHSTDETIEQEGIRRSYQAMEKADLILLILDASRPLYPEDRELLAKTPPEKTLLILNKIDLLRQAAPLDFPSQVQISAKQGIGLEELKEKIHECIWKKGPPAKDEIVLTSLRHKEALSEAAHALSQVTNGLKSGVSAEFVSSDMRAALQALSRIIGKDITEEILSSIFSKFCVGK